MGDLKEFLERQLAAAWEEQSCGHTCCAQVRLQVIADLKDLNARDDVNITSAKQVEQPFLASLAQVSSPAEIMPIYPSKPVPGYVSWLTT